MLSLYFGGISDHDLVIKFLGREHDADRGFFCKASLFAIRVKDTKEIKLPAAGLGSAQSSDGGSGNLGVSLTPSH